MAGAVLRRLRGALPSPANEILALPVFRAALSIPTSYAVVPKRLSYWGNQTYGCCVTTEEAYAKACYSIMRALVQTFITENTVIDWARQRGYLWGATLTSVMRDMRQDGIRDENG